MGKKERYCIPLTLPFYTQRMTEQNWEEEQFPSFAEADSWTMRSCGIASLRMVLDGFGKCCERHGAMIRKGAAAGAYKEGVGWIHKGLSDLASEYGLYAGAVRNKSISELKQALDAGCPCIISIAPRFWGGKPKPDGSGIYGKSGHLIPVFGYETENGEITSFLVHHPSAFPEYDIPNWNVPIGAFTDSFGGNFIWFSEKLPAFVKEWEEREN